MNSKEFVNQWRDGLKMNNGIESTMVMLYNGDIVFAEGYELATDYWKKGYVRLYRKHEFIALIKLSRIESVDFIEDD